MARRAWVIDKVKETFPETPVVLLDSGNFSDNPTAEGDKKTGALLEAMAKLGYQVVNVGERDIRMGYDDFLKRTEGTPFDYVSANLVRQDTEEPIFKPYTVVETASADGEKKVRVGVIGVVRYNPMFLKAGPDGGNMVVAHPTEPVRRAVAALREEKVDRIVLLAAMRKDDARRVAQEVEGIDYVLGSYGGVFTRGNEKQGVTSILYCGNRGQRIIETRVFLADEKQDSVTVHFLTRQYPAEQKMLDFVNSVVPKAPAPAAPASSALPSRPQGARAAS